MEDIEKVTPEVIKPEVEEKVFDRKNALATARAKKLEKKLEEESNPKPVTKEKDEHTDSNIQVVHLPEGSWELRAYSSTGYKVLKSGTKEKVENYLSQLQALVDRMN